MEPGRARRHANSVKEEKMKKALLVFMAMALFALGGCATMTGSQGEGKNKLKKSPCATIVETTRHV